MYLAAWERRSQREVFDETGDVDSLAAGGVLSKKAEFWASKREHCVMVGRGGGLKGLPPPSGLLAASYFSPNLHRSFFNPDKSLLSKILNSGLVKGNDYVSMTVDGVCK